jgi:hypothetical protein
LQAPDEASRATQAEQDARAPAVPVGRRGTLGSVGSEPWASPARQLEIDTRLAAVCARLKQLRDRERGLGGVWNGTGITSERVAAAQRRAAEAHAAAAEGLASCAEAFRIAADAHERGARMHDRTAAAGVGDVIGHERQATLHRAAAAADRRRAERVQSLLSGTARAGRAAIPDEPGDGVAP